MGFYCVVLCLLLFGCHLSIGSTDVTHQSAHRGKTHHATRRHRALTDGELRFEPAPYSKKLELNSTGKIHCKVAGGVSPTVEWFLNDSEPLPDGVSSSNGTLLVNGAGRQHSGVYTCVAGEGGKTIRAPVTLQVVVSPKVLEPSGEAVSAAAGGAVWLTCRADGDPLPSTHWDRNLTVMHPSQEGVEVEDGDNVTNARIVLFKNGSLLIRSAREQDSDRYGCTAGSAAGLARAELILTVHPAGEFGSETVGLGGKAVVVSVSVAAAYMALVLALMLYCRRRRHRNIRRDEKIELEMAEGREKLVEDGEEKKPANGTAHNGRLMTHDRDSGADNSEVSGVSRVSKKSGQYDHLAVPRTLLTELITLGRGEFGDVMLGKVDMSGVRRLRRREPGPPATRPVLVKALTTKHEAQLLEFRRQMELFGAVSHARVVKLVGLCNDAEPHYMLLQHTDWGDLKTFLLATRTEEEEAEYQRSVGRATASTGAAAGATNGATSGAGSGATSGAGSGAERRAAALGPAHRVSLAMALAEAGRAVAAVRLTHRDIAARNCVITSSLQLRLSLPALTRGPHSAEYYKLHDQVVPLRWLPAEAALEGEYSTKSDVYMFAATVWEIYTKAELPFAKLNDNSVVERLKANSLEWTVPASMPDKLSELLKRCWSNSPSERPQFEEICSELTSLVQDLTADTSSQTQHDQ